jgi:hypothetical protein
MKVINELTVYKENDEKVAVGGPELIVESAFADSSCVCLKYRGVKIQVSADTLQKAITNATNVKW